MGSTPGIQFGGGVSKSTAGFIHEEFECSRYGIERQVLQIVILISSRIVYIKEFIILDPDLLLRGVLAAGNHQEAEVVVAEAAVGTKCSPSYRKCPLVQALHAKIR